MSTPARPGKPAKKWTVPAVILLLAGATIMGLTWPFAGPQAAIPPPAQLRQSERPGPAASSPAVPAASASGPALPSGPPAAPLSFSAPVQIAIPAIGVRAAMIGLGENPDGTVRVPALSTPQLTSWFDDGPAPGQTGPAAVYGHVDTAASVPAVFYRLGDLLPGAQVDITRADHRVAVFAVYRVAEYAKDAFPTMTVYGDTPGPELRLITCGGAFDAASGGYLDNIVVYARLTAVRSA